MGKASTNPENESINTKIVTVFARLYLSEVCLPVGTGFGAPKSVSRIFRLIFCIG